MSTRLPLVLTVLILFASTGRAQVRIHEIGLLGTDFEGATKWVELYNAGPEEIDVSDHFLCSYPIYPTISNLTVLAGSTTIPAGGYVVLAWADLGDTDGEVGLYESGTVDFGDATKMLDYMQYGSAGHFRETTAVTAGIWEAEAFVELPDEGQTLSLVASGGGFSGDWRATSASPNAANPALYRAVLSGGNQTPAIPSRAQGSVEGMLEGTTLTVSGSFAGLESDFNAAAAGGAHLHQGLAGQGGGIEVALTTALDPDNRGGAFEVASNALSLTAEQVTLLEERKLYVNIHSADHSGGEIRGQMLPATSEAYKAALSSSGQVPVNTSPGRGNVVAEIQNDTTLIVSGAFAGLQSDYNANVAGGSHLHTGLAGQGGGITIFLTPDLNVDIRGGVYEAADNTYPLTEEQAEAIRQRGLYVNIHTTDFPGGEIRGQLMGLSSTPFIASLSGAHAVPANASRGTGGVLAELSGNNLWVSGSFNGLYDEFNANIAGGAHIHDGLAGQGGGISIPLNTTLAENNLSGTFDLENNTFELADEDIDALQERANYVNIHTAFSSSGELRGQLLPGSSVQLRAAFTGRAQGDPNASQGIGGAMLELNGTSLTVSGGFSNLSSPLATEVGAHIHDGFIDEEGGVEHVLTPTLAAGNQSGSFAAAENTFELSEEQVANLLAAQNYINIHSETNTGGEIRGQIVPLAYGVFEAYLAFDNEVIVSTGKQASSPVAHLAAQSEATGGAIALLSDTTLTLAGHFSGLESDFNADVAGGAHIHMASANANGGITFPLITTLDGDNRGGAFEAEPNTLALTDEQVDALFERQFYLNVHSMDHAGGEIRGQLLASGNVAPNAPSITAPEDGAIIVITGEPDTPLTHTWNGGDANADSVYYTWQLSADDTFETPVLDIGTGTTPAFSTTYGEVAALLTASGVELDGSITLYHRAIATDGSFVRVGDAGSVTLTRGAITSADDHTGLPERFALLGNYPNPFNPSTTVRFDLPAPAEVSIEVHDVLGRRVLTIPAQRMEAGRSMSVPIDASSLASGIYLYRVIAKMKDDLLIQSSRMTLVK